MYLMYLEYTSLSRAFAVDICKLPQHSMYMTQNTRGCHSPWLINLKKGSYKIGVIQIVYNCFRHSSGNWNKVRIKHKWIRDAVELHRIILPLATCPTLVTTLRWPERLTHNFFRENSNEKELLALRAGEVAAWTGIIQAVAQVETRV